MNSQETGMCRLKHYLRVSGAIVAMAAMFGCGSPALEPLPRDATILAFGDSLTAGVGATVDTSYPAVLEELTGRRVINAGVSGETTDKGLQRLPRELDMAAPDLVIIIEGGNDLLQGRNSSAIKANIRKMIELSKSRGIQVVLIGIPARKLFSNSAPFYAELAEEFQLVFDGTLIGSLQRSPSLKSDYVHFNAKGYRAMAESVYELLKEHGGL
jgi:lysophospholipase L1-like esterase